MRGFEDEVGSGSFGKFIYIFSIFFDRIKLMILRVLELITLFTDYVLFSIYEEYFEYPELEQNY